MYGLFRYKYDHFEFERLVCVSTSHESLKNQYEQIRWNHMNGRKLAVTTEEHHEFALKEISHYMIAPINQI